MKLFIFINLFLISVVSFGQGQTRRVVPYKCQKAGLVVASHGMLQEKLMLCKYRGKSRTLDSVVPSKDDLLPFFQSISREDPFRRQWATVTNRSFDDFLNLLNNSGKVHITANQSDPDYQRDRRGLDTLVRRYNQWKREERPSSSASTSIYNSCTQIGETEMGYFKNNRGREYGQVCQIMVKGCKEGDSLVSGTVKAYCDHAECNRSRELPIRCDCPTDPNECVNDDPGDGHTNYTNVSRIPQTIYKSDYFLSQITEAAKQNRSIIEELQSGVRCNLVQGELKRVRISFSDGEPMNILPIDSFSGTNYHLTFLYGCIGVSQELFMDECSQRQERQISISPVIRDLSWRSPDNKTYPIQSVDPGGSSDNCNVQRNLRAGNVNILSRGRGTTRDSGGRGQGN